MPDRRRVRCRNCRKHEREVGPISWTGKCVPCAKLLCEDALDQLDAHQGPVFDYWRVRLAASVGATLAAPSTVRS